MRQSSSRSSRGLQKVAHVILLLSLIFGACGNRDKEDIHEERIQIQPAFLAHQYFKLLQQRLRSDPVLRARYEKELSESIVKELEGSSASALTRELDQNDQASLMEGGILLVDSSKLVQVRESQRSSTKEKAYPVVQLPAKAYARWVMTSFRKADPNAEQSILGALRNSFGNLGSESDVLGALDNSFSSPTDQKIDTIFDFNNRNFAVLNGIREQDLQRQRDHQNLDYYNYTIPPVRSYSPSPVEFPSGTQPYGAGTSGPSSQPGNAKVATVVPPAPHGNTFSGTCAALRMYIATVGVYSRSGAQHHASKAGVTIATPRFNWQITGKVFYAGGEGEKGKECYREVLNTKVPLISITEDEITWLSSDPGCSAEVFRWNAEAIEHEQRHVHDYEQIARQFEARLPLTLDVCAKNRAQVTKLVKTKREEVAFLFELDLIDALEKETSENHAQYGQEIICHECGSELVREGAFPFYTAPPTPRRVQVRVLHNIR